MKTMIRVLSDELANQIAAGEVVERPASVVKELVENALDAGARRITVEITGGGLDSIKVTDDGTGIPHDQVPTAFLPHATSKISSVLDLSRIESLGFRGEALSSIAAVSKVTVLTRVEEEIEGTRFVIHAGEQKEHVVSGASKGTLVLVEDLFYNTPARRKFLKSQRTEAGYVSDYISRMILARPDVSFTLINQGKTVYQSLGLGDTLSAVYSVYSRDILRSLKELSFDDGYLLISGYAGDETMPRPNRQQQSFFINGRYVKMPKLSYALERAYSQRIMTGRYPFAVINLRISSNEIDVNVHPNKLDVRFVNEDRVLSAITRSVREALGDPVAHKAAWPAYSKTPKPVSPGEIPRKDFDAQEAAKGVEKEQTRLQDIQNPFKRKEEIYNKPVGRQEDLRIFKEKEPQVLSPKVDKPVKSVMPQETATIQPTVRQEEREIITPREVVGELKEQLNTTLNESSVGFNGLIDPPVLLQETREGEEKEENAIPRFSKPSQQEFSAEPFRIVGHLFDTYWIVQQGKDVFFIDQHAAHERMMYETLSKNLTVGSQQLLIPITVTLSPLERSVLEEEQETFESLGFEIDIMGERDVFIRAVPYLLGQIEGPDLLREAIDALLKQKKATPLELKREAIIQASCKHAIKAGDAISREEVEALLSYFQEEGIPMTCPHGRPVMVRLTKRELEKMFKRIV